MKPALLKLFIFFGVLSCNLINAADFSLDFFNVGQGNCTVAYFGKGTAPLLVDAGSSAFDKDVDIEEGSDDEEAEAGVSFRKQRLSEIGERIKGALPKTMGKNFPHLNVIISHGDGDHCNWMVDLIEFIKRDRGPLRIRILLGGTESDYEVTSLSNVKAFSKSLRNDSYNDRIYAGEYKKIDEIPPFECGTGECSILAADTKTSDKNRHSIVLEVKKGPTRAILTGDVPGKIVGQILKTFSSVPSIKTTIFQASHHGADTHGSNSSSSFERLKPNYCIISAGSRKDYGHPRQLMIKNALSSPNIREDSVPHFLQYYSDWPFIDFDSKLENHQTVALLDSNFMIGLTKLGIFSTASQGDIHFEEENFTFSKGPPLRSNEDRESLFLMNSFLESVAHGHSPMLSFILPSSRFVSQADFFSLLDRIVTTQSNLISCDLSRADLSTLKSSSDPIDPSSIIRLIDSLGNLRELSLPLSLIDSTTKETIAAKWREKNKNDKNLRFSSYGSQ